MVRPPRLTPPARALLVGYFGHGNAGDEWILRALLDALGDRRCAVVVGPRPGNLGDAAAVPRTRPLRLWRSLRSCGAVVLGGGELFQNRTSLRSLLYYLFFPLWARACGRPVAAVGVSVDPALSRGWRAIVRTVLRGATVWARDADSAAVLSAAGGTSAGVDSVWGRGLQGFARPTSLKRVLWIPRAPASAEEWAGKVNGLRALEPWDHGFLMMHPAQDRALLGALRARLTFPHRLETWERPEEVWAILGRYDLVVSMRYHGLVAAALTSRPAAALAAHGKVDVLARELGASRLSWGATATDWRERIRAAFDRGPASPGERPDVARRDLAALERWLSDAGVPLPSQNL